LDNIPQDKIAYDITAIITFEEVATLAHIDQKARSFVEVNCHDKMVRALSSSMWVNGRMKSHSSGLSNWGHIPPESNVSNLHKILCK
jgi:hypothetical protein